MKIKTISSVLVISLMLTLLLTGCGGGGGDTSGNTATPVDAVPEVVEQDMSEQITEAANTEADVDTFEGDWIGTDDESLFVKITKDGDKYKYEDNDGAYEAALKDGILKVTVGENDFADAYVDKDTGNLVLTYMDNVLSYKKK